MAGMSQQLGLCTGILCAAPANAPQSLVEQGLAHKLSQCGVRHRRHAHRARERPRVATRWPLALVRGVVADARCARVASARHGQPAASTGTTRLALHAHGTLLGDQPGCGVAACGIAARARHGDPTRQSSAARLWLQAPRAPGTGSSASAVSLALTLTARPQHMEAVVMHRGVCNVVG